MQGVWLIAYLEHIFLISKAETSRCSLQIIQSLSHVTIISKDDSFKPLWHIRNLGSTKTEIQDAVKLIYSFDGLTGNNSQKKTVTSSRGKTQFRG
uniref:Pco108913 n=1 Tax=Arundo donax TaxID=35708 RepID=A0A0A9CLK0_ARUDO